MLKSLRIWISNPWINPRSLLHIYLIEPSREDLSKMITRNDNFIEEYTFHEWNGSSRAFPSHVRRNRYRRAGSIPRPATTAGNRFRVWSSSFAFSVLVSATIHIDSFWSITRDQAGRCARSWLPRCAFRRASPRFERSLSLFRRIPDDPRTFESVFATYIDQQNYNTPSFLPIPTWMQKSEEIYFKLKHIQSTFFR